MEIYRCLTENGCVILVPAMWCELTPPASMRKHSLFMPPRPLRTPLQPRTCGNEEALAR
jgi:hypothetical protein